MEEADRARSSWFPAPLVLAIGVVSPLAVASCGGGEVREYMQSNRTCDHRLEYLIWTVTQSPAALDAVFCLELVLRALFQK
jgi:hypothetical protein